MKMKCLHITVTITIILMMTMLTIGINDDCDDDNDVNAIFLNETFNDDNIWYGPVYVTLRLR